MGCYEEVVCCEYWFYSHVLPLIYPKHTYFIFSEILLSVVFGDATIAHTVLLLNVATANICILISFFVYLCVF